MDNYKQKTAPYKIHQPEILFDLSEHKKEGAPPELFMSLVGQMKEKYRNYKYIYTDGSKVEEKVLSQTQKFLWTALQIIHQFSQLRLKQLV